MHLYLVDERAEFSGPFYDEVRTLLLSARESAVRGVNLLQVHTNYEIGRRIVEQEQRGAGRAEYGKELLKGLSVRLTAEFGQASQRAISSTCDGSTWSMWTGCLQFPRRCLGCCLHSDLHLTQQFPRQRLGNLENSKHSFRSPLAGPTTSSFWDSRTRNPILRNRGSRTELDPERAQATIQLRPF